jgi:hypothetical protein
MMNKLLQVLTVFGVILGSTCLTARATNLQIREGRPVVDGVYVNGHGPYKFLVDTGATLNHIDLQLAKSIGLKEAFHTTLTTSVGVTPASGGTGIEVMLGPVSAINQTFLFAGLDTIQQYQPDVQGVLGQDFLSHFDYLLDMRGKQLEFGRRELGSKATQAPYRIDHGRPVVSTSIGSLVVDSGIQRVTRFGVKATDAAFELKTLSGTAQLGTVSSTLTIAGRCFWHGDAMALPQSAEAGVDGLLPASLFKSVYVSNSQGYIAFE